MERQLEFREGCESGRAGRSRGYGAYLVKVGRPSGSSKSFGISANLAPSGPSKIRLGLFAPRRPGREMRLFIIFPTWR